MKVALVGSNRFSYKKETRKGMEIITRALINELAKHKKEVQLTAFISGDSDVQVPIQSVGRDPFFKAQDESLKIDKVVVFELALISKAISMQNEFDLFHINIGDGDLVMPFARFCKKPILITLHAVWDNPYEKEYFSLFSERENVFFVPISNAQRKLLPNVNYFQTIHNGLDVQTFSFDPVGGEIVMWAGRAIADKGPDIVIDAVCKTPYNATLFAIPKAEQTLWFEKKVKTPIQRMNEQGQISLITNANHEDLIAHYQKSKLFLFPTRHEEPFGLVLIEAMSCGTPIVAYAKGAIPEVVKDGVTGFIVNESDNDIRGDWIIKKTGIEGLTEAVEKIYSMPEDEYLAMRKTCRKHIEENFTIEKMTNQYIQVYKNVLEQWTKK